jgi:hypothetical protein
MSMSELQVGAGDAPKTLSELTNRDGLFRAARKADIVQMVREPSVQFHILEWDDPAAFARDFRICEGVYGRSPSDLDVERAYARYKKLAVAE